MMTKDCSTQESQLTDVLKLAADKLVLCSSISSHQNLEEMSISRMKALESDQ